MKVLSLKNKQKMPIRLTILFLFFTSQFCMAQQVVVHAALDSNTILLGDQVNLNIIVNQVKDKSNITGVDLSPLEEVEEIEVVNISNWDTTATAKELILRKSITLTSFDSGYYYIPQIPIRYDEFGLQRSAQTPRLGLAVNTIPPLDSIQIAPNKDIIEEPLKFEDFIPAIATILGLLLLGFLIRYFWRRKQAEPVPPPPEIIVPAHEIALTQLGSLQEAKLWQQGKVKEYQSQLTHIVREYIENRYDIQALESTTDQILKQLKRVDFDKDWKQKVREMLQMADLVKFAKAEPPADFHARMMTTAEKFVLATKKKEVIMENEGTENE